MTPPTLPKGITRDDTQHGRMYYTLQQMRDYGRACAAAHMAQIDAARMRHNSSGQNPEVINELFGFLGKKGNEK